MNIPGDLWPEDVADTDVTAPVSILKAQARRLGARTAWKITADVDSVGIGSTFRHTFTLQAKRLSYSYELFTVEHGIEFYPLYVFFENFERGRVEVRSEEELTRLLGEIFNSDLTRRIIRSLVAQIEA
jgi:hypothetical protein